MQGVTFKVQSTQLNPILLYSVLLNSALFQSMVLYSIPSQSNLYYSFCPLFCVNNRIRKNILWQPQCTNRPQCLICTIYTVTIHLPHHYNTFTPQHDGKEIVLCDDYECGNCDNDLQVMCSFLSLIQNDQILRERKQF